MAKKPMDTMVQYVAVGGVSYIFYKMALGIPGQNTGAFGADIQTAMISLRNSLKGAFTNIGMGTAPSTGPTAPSTGITSPPPPDLYGPFTQELANHNFAEQMRTWRYERWSRGENYHDWSALRQHLIAIGAPDPGPTPVAGF